MWQALGKTVSSKFLPSELQQKLKYNCISRSIPTFRNHYRNNFFHFFTHPQLPATHTYLTLHIFAGNKCGFQCPNKTQDEEQIQFQSKTKIRNTTQHPSVCLETADTE